MADQIRIRMFGGFSLFVNNECFDQVIKLYPVKRTRERVTFEPTSPVYGR